MSSFHFGNEGGNRHKDAEPRSTLLILVGSMCISMVVSPSMIFTDGIDTMPILISVLSFALYEDLSILVAIISLSLHFHTSRFFRASVVNKDSQGLEGVSATTLFVFITLYMIQYYFIFVCLWRPFFLTRRSYSRETSGGLINHSFFKGFESLLCIFYSLDPILGLKALLEDDQRFKAILNWHLPIKYLLLAYTICETVYFNNLQIDERSKGSRISMKEWNKINKS